MRFCTSVFWFVILASDKNEWLRKVLTVGYCSGSYQWGSMSTTKTLKLTILNPMNAPSPLCTRHFVLFFFFLSSWHVRASFMPLSYLIYAEISSQAWFIVLVVRQAISLKACLVHWRPERGHSDWKSKIEQRPLEDNTRCKKMKMKYFFFFFGC